MSGGGVMYTQACAHILSCVQSKAHRRERQEQSSIDTGTTTDTETERISGNESK